MSGRDLVPKYTAVELITLERERQIHNEGYTSERDDAYINDELIASALAYITEGGVTWPWTNSSCEYKPTTRIRDLTKAGALIAAEIDRLQRLEVRSGGS